MPLMRSAVFFAPARGHNKQSPASSQYAASPHTPFEGAHTDVSGGAALIWQSSSTPRGVTTSLEFEREASEVSVLIAPTRDNNVPVSTCTSGTATIPRPPCEGSQTGTFTGHRAPDAPVFIDPTGGSQRIEVPDDVVPDFVSSSPCEGLQRGLQDVPSAGLVPSSSLLPGTTTPQADTGLLGSGVALIHRASGHNAMCGWFSLCPQSTSSFTLRGVTTCGTRCCPPHPDRALIAHRGVTTRTASAAP